VPRGGVIDAGSGRAAFRALQAAFHDLTTVEPGLRIRVDRGLMAIEEEHRVDEADWDRLVALLAAAAPADHVGVTVDWARSTLLTGPLLVARQTRMARIMPLPVLADFLTREHGVGASVVEALIKALPGLTVTTVQRRLQPYLLGGRFVYWATFDAHGTRNVPVPAAVLGDRARLLDALGLDPGRGHLPHVCLVYDLAAYTVEPGHRVVCPSVTDAPQARYPTVAEALAGVPEGWNPYFRVAPAGEPHGWTEDWSGRRSVPECVHEPVGGNAIVDRVLII
jgi:hypothetical protein